MGVRGQYVFLLTLDKGHFITVIDVRSSWTFPEFDYLRSTCVGPIRLSMGVRGQYVFLLTLDKGHFITVIDVRSSWTFPEFDYLRSTCVGPILSTAFIRLAGLTSEHPDVPFQKATPE